MFRIDRLPTAAQVAATTEVDPNTTLKAYRELERAEVRQEAGTFRPLAASGSGPDWPLRSSLNEWMHRARAEGLSGQGVRALFDASFAAAYLSDTDG